METAKAYKITYASVDKEIREFIWKFENRYNDPAYQEIAEDAIKFINTGVWTKRNASDETCNLWWGLNRLWRLPNEVQYVFYHRIVKGITYAIGERCVKEKDFAKQLLKEATRKAKEQDKAFIEDLFKKGKESAVKTYERDNRKQLERAKSRIRYNEKKEYDWALECEYVGIVEEYGLYKILKMEPYEYEVSCC